MQAKKLLHLMILILQPEHGIAERKKVISEADMLLSVNPLLEDDINSFREGQVLCSVLNPVENCKWLESIQEERADAPCS